MRKQTAIIFAIIGACIAGAAVYAQSTNYSIREVRDPVQFRDKINDDMGDIESRVAAMEAVTNGGALAAAKVLVGNAAGIAAAVDVSGDATINTNGALTVAARAITAAKLFAVAPASLVIGNASSNATATAASGDVTVTTSGVFTAVGITTNIDVLVAGGGTNTLSFTNGILRVSTSL